MKVLYMRVAGTKTGDFEEVPSKNGPPDSVAIVSFRHQVEIPYDPKTGSAIGRRQHGPVTVEKRIDWLTPILAGALQNGKHLGVSFLWYAEEEGRIAHYFTTSLEKALCVAQEMSSDGSAQREKLKFIYEGIFWEHIPSGTSTRVP